MVTKKVTFASAHRGSGVCEASLEALRAQTSRPARTNLERVTKYPLKL